MSNIRKFILSCDLFGGYKIDINIDECNDFDDIILLGINSLKKTLTKNNFEFLLDKLNKIKYHIHDFTFVDILMETDITMIYYICGHC